MNALLCRMIFRVDDYRLCLIMHDKYVADINQYNLLMVIQAPVSKSQRNIVYHYLIK